MADIIHQIAINAPPRAIFSLVTGASGMSQWWAEDVANTPDGVLELGFFNRTTVYRLRPQTQLAPTRAVWSCESGNEWAGTQLAFDLNPTDAGTTVRFRHGGWKAKTDFFASCNTTWGALMYRLKTAAEGGKPGPLFTRAGLGS